MANCDSDNLPSVVAHMKEEKDDHALVPLIEFTGTVALLVTILNDNEGLRNIFSLF